MPIDVPQIHPSEAPAPPLLLTLEEAAESLRISLPHFRRHVLPDIRTVRIKTAVRVPVAELERWVHESTAAGDKN